MTDEYFSQMFREAFWEVWGPIIEEWQREWEENRYLLPRNDLQLFHEPFTGLLYGPCESPSQPTAESGQP